MARGPSVAEVKGAKELKTSLKLAGDDLDDLKDAHQAVGNLIVTASRSKAPVVSGALAGSIRATRTVGGVGIKAGGAKVPYANPIHWGWPSRGIKANRFIWDTAKRMEADWVQLYFEELEKVVNKIEGA